MTSAAGVGMDAEMCQKFTDDRDPEEGMLTTRSVIYDATNLNFLHRVADRDVREWPRVHHKLPHRAVIPADRCKDITHFAFGHMPYTLTVRPLENESCTCCAPREFHIARDMMGDPVARATISATGCLYQWGCGNADIAVEPINGVSGPTYRGSLTKSICGECCFNETTMMFITPTRPQMTYKGLSSTNCCKCTTWLGWRGTSTAVPQRTATHDASVNYNCCQRCELWCTNCKCSKDRCCSVDDTAPRFARPDDIRAAVLTRYDFALAYKENVEDDDEQETSQGEGQEDPNVTRRLPAGHDFCALVSSRLYHDVVCCKPHVMFARRNEDEDRSTEGKCGPEDHQREAAIDVRYRGGRRHNEPRQLPQPGEEGDAAAAVDHKNVNWVATEDDHLLPLMTALMHALWTFPGESKKRAANTAGEQLRGVLALASAEMTMDGQYASKNSV